MTDHIFEAVQELKVVADSWVTLANAMVIEGKRQAKKSRRLLSVVVILVCAGLLMTGLLVLNSLNNRPIIKATQNTTETLDDCLTPGGVCYEEQQSRMAASIAAIAANANQSNKQQTTDFINAIFCVDSGGTLESCLAPLQNP
jgi:hypothetical protein